MHRMTNREMRDELAAILREDGMAIESEIQDCAKTGRTLPISFERRMCSLEILQTHLEEAAKVIDQDGPDAISASLKIVYDGVKIMREMRAAAEGRLAAPEETLAAESTPEPLRPPIPRPPLLDMLGMPTSPKPGRGLFGKHGL